jgi:hypothetical protein
MKELKLRENYCQWKEARKRESKKHELTAESLERDRRKPEEKRWES